MVRLCIGYKKENFLYMGILIILTLLIYSNTLHFGFVTDDYDQIVFDNRIKKIENIFDFFLNPIPNSLNTQYYRPFFTLSLSWDHFLWGLNPFGYHLTNVLLFCLFLICVFIFTDIFVKNEKKTFLISLFFIVHPIHSETVSWISARNEILMGIFFLISFILYINFSIDKKHRMLFLSYTFFLCALFSKETAVVLPIILLLYDFLFNNNNKNKIIFLPYIIILVLYAVIRVKILDAPFGAPTSLIKKLYAFFIIEKESLKLLLFPVNLKVLYHNLIPLIPTFSLELIYSVIIVIFFILLMLFFLKKNKTIGFFMLFYFITTLPYSGLVAIIRVSPIADRYLFLPSLGFLIFAFLFYEKVRYKIGCLKFSKVFIICMIFFLTYLTVNRNKHYENNFSYLLKMVEHAPYYYEGYNGLGVEFLGKGQFENAELCFLKAIELSVPTSYRVYVNLGTLYMRLNKIDEAKHYFMLVIENESDSRIKSLAYYNLGIIYLEEGKINKAEDFFKKSIQLNKNYANSYNNLGVIYFKRGNLEEAKKMFLEALTINPDHKEAIENIKKIEHFYYIIQ